MLLNTILGYDLWLQSSSDISAGTLVAYLIVCGIVFALMIAALWKIFTKAGRPGWKCLIPGYNIWVLFEIICGQGAKMFLLLIPIYGIIVGIKSCIRLAHAFGKSTGFGIGLVFIPYVFLCILAFGSAKYVGPQQM